MILIYTFLVLFVIALVEVTFKPRLDYADKKLLLWYGIRERKYIEL